MNFKGHLTGSVVASLVTTGTTLGVMTTGFFPEYFEVNILAVAGLTFLFAHFPDFDIASIPQRWFYRCMFFVYGILFYLKQHELANTLAVLTTIPLVHKHRGITHSVIFSIIFPLILACLVEYHLTESYSPVGIMAQKYIVYIIAVIVGWWTHLFLDFKLVRKVANISK